MSNPLPPAPIDSQFGSYNWADWYEKVRRLINNVTVIAWSQIADFTGSNLTQIATRSHQSLQSIKGTLVDNTAFGHVPVGGTTNQVLAKASNTDYDYSWVAGPSGTYVLKAGDTMSGALTINTTTQNIVTFNSTHAGKGFYGLQNSGTPYAYIGTSTALIGAGTAGSLGIRAETGGIEFSTNGFGLKMTLDSTGNLGIGTAPSTLLHLYAPTPVLRFTQTTLNSLQGIEFHANVSVVGSLKVNSNTGEMRHDAGFAGYGGYQTFYTNGVLRATIDTGGTFTSTVGVTAPTFLASGTGGQVQTTSVTNNFGLGLFSPTLAANQQAVSAISLLRETFNSTAGTGNDLTDKVGIWIKGFYQGLGGNMPIYLGGPGFNSEACALHIDNQNVLREGKNGNELGYKSIPVQVTAGAVNGKCWAVAAGVTLATQVAEFTYSIYNDSAAAITLTQGGGLTLRLAGTATTGNRTLAARGICTVWHYQAAQAIISGAGVT